MAWQIADFIRVERLMVNGFSSSSHWTMPMANKDGKDGRT